ncbi:MAG: M48 family metallopeptidase [Acidobacteriaceae bacterium]
MLVFAAATTTKCICSMPPQKLAEAVALSHWGIGLYFGGTAWLLLTLWLAARAGAPIARLAARISERPWLQGLVAAPLWLLIFVALNLPLALLGHHAGLHFGLSVESWPAWWGDWAKSTGISIAIGTVVLSVLYALVRHAPRRWWLWFWIITIPVEVFAVFVTPIVIDPLFNKFEPLQKVDPALVDQLERVAARGGLHIPPSRIFLMDASRRVTGPNAYVTGLGASKRIVVWDTTIHEETPDQILFTYGHEQGHYVLHHVAKGIAFSVPIILFFYWIGFLLLGWLVRVRGPQWGIASAGSWSSLGLVLFLLVGLSCLADPIGNAISRHIEHQADVYGQEVIHGLVPSAQQAAVSSFCSDAQLWLDNPHPNALVEFWTYSHPSTEQRAEFAEHYDPWLPGRHPQYFSNQH